MIFDNPFKLFKDLNYAYDVFGQVNLSDQNLS